MLWKLIQNVANIYREIANLQQLQQTTKIWLIIVLLHCTDVRYYEWAFMKSKSFMKYIKFYLVYTTQKQNLALLQFKNKRIGTMI